MAAASIHCTISSGGSRFLSVSAFSICNMLDDFFSSRYFLCVTEISRDLASVNGIEFGLLYLNWCLLGFTIANWSFYVCATTSLFYMLILGFFIQIGPEHLGPADAGSFLFSCLFLHNWSLSSAILGLSWRSFNFKTVKYGLNCLTSTFKSKVQKETGSEASFSVPSLNLLYL